MVLSISISDLLALPVLVYEPRNGDELFRVYSIGMIILLDR